MLNEHLHFTDDFLILKENPGLVVGCVAVKIGFTDAKVRFNSRMFGLRHCRRSRAARTHQFGG
jgi:hypothetical protein